MSARILFASRLCRFSKVLQVTFQMSFFEFAPLYPMRPLVREKRTVEQLYRNNIVIFLNTDRNVRRVRDRRPVKFVMPPICPMPKAFCRGYANLL